MLKRVISTLLTVLLFSLAYPQETGKASYYGKQHHGKKTASGEVFNMYALTCASNKHPLGARLKITNPENNKSVIVRNTDRGGFGKYGRIVDLSQGAFATIANVGRGLIKVIVERID